MKGHQRADSVPLCPASASRNSGCLERLDEWRRQCVGPLLWIVVLATVTWNLLDLRDGFCQKGWDFGQTLAYIVWSLQVLGPTPPPPPTPYCSNQTLDLGLLCSFSGYPKEPHESWSPWTPQSCILLSTSFFILELRAVQGSARGHTLQQLSGRSVLSCFCFRLSSPSVSLPLSPLLLFPGARS